MHYHFNNLCCLLFFAFRTRNEFIVENWGLDLVFIRPSSFKTVKVTWYLSILQQFQFPLFATFDDLSIVFTCVDGNDWGLCLLSPSDTSPYGYTTTPTIFNIINKSLQSIFKLEVNRINSMLQEKTKHVYIHTKKYRLAIVQVEIEREGGLAESELRFFLDSKSNNIVPIKYTAVLNMQEKQLKVLFRKLCALPIYINPFHPRITLLQNLSIILNDTTSHFTQKEIRTFDEDINFGLKYWKTSGRQEIEGCIGWPVQINTRQKISHQELMVGQLDPFYEHTQNIRLLSNQNKSLDPRWKRNERKKKEKKIKEMKRDCYETFKKIFASGNLKINYESSAIQTDNQLHPHLPLSTIRAEKHSQKLTFKQELFRHIFLTEVITSMILNQFGKRKKKQKKQKDGRINYFYEDEGLQVLRSFGHRFSSLGDYSVEKFHLQEEGEEQSDSQDSEEFKESDEWNKQEKKKSKKTEASRVGKKIKVVSKKKIRRKKNKRIILP